MNSVSCCIFKSSSLTLNCCSMSKLSCVKLPPLSLSLTVALLLTMLSIDYLATSTNSRWAYSIRDPTSLSFLVSISKFSLNALVWSTCYFLALRLPSVRSSLNFLMSRVVCLIWLLASLSVFFALIRFGRVSLSVPICLK